MDKDDGEDGEEVIVDSIGVVDARATGRRTICGLGVVEDSPEPWSIGSLGGLGGRGFSFWAHGF